MKMKLDFKVSRAVVLVQFLTSVLSVDGLSDVGVWAEDECRRTLREALSVPVKVPSPPNLSGHWTSSRCEVRPGPEFVLRKYLFRRTSFQAQLFYYIDESCHDVTHYIIARGTLKTSRPSWRTPGSFETRYSLSEVSVIPYKSYIASAFGKNMRRYCEEAGVTDVSLNKKFRIFQFTKYSKNNDNNNFLENDLDCTKLFNFTLNELQLVRIEKRKVKPIQASEMPRIPRTRVELFLGDISTNMEYRRQYVPTHYQAPLMKARTKDCEVCRIIRNASHSSPPRLPVQRKLEVSLAGDWVTPRCETRPNGNYLTRYLSFFSDGKSWKGSYEFYRDALCSESSFRIEVKGSYFKGQRSNKVKTAYNYVFKTTRLKVTPLDFQMVGFLNNYLGRNCGENSSWEIRKTKDVTSTNGCVALGITLPNVEYELMKTEYEHRGSFLYVGQRPSDFVSLSTPKNRPTSFQSPLLKCGEQNVVKKEKSLPVYSQYSGFKSSNTEILASTGISVYKAKIFAIIFLMTSTLIIL